MASTAEELSSQADQLQTTISFFKTNGVDQRALPAAAARKAVRPVHHAQIAHVAPVAPRAAKPGTGVRLDMTKPGVAKADVKDHDFEKF
jgi:methyl-accepting chemotaxis protein